MFRNYLKTGLRALWKHKGFSAINILGLSVGIAFMLLIGAYAWSEWNVNSVIKDSHRAFIIQSKWKQEGMGLDFTVPAPLGKRLYEEYPHLVENYYHWDGLRTIVSKGNKHFRESIQTGDPTFLAMFGFKLLHGDAKTALDNPDNVVITRETAIKYFGRTDVVGERLTVQSFQNNKKDFTVTGVLAELPFNSVADLGNERNNLFFSYKTLQFFQQGRDVAFEQWTNVYIPSYVRLKPGVSPRQLEAPVKQLLAKYAPPDIQSNLHVYFTPLSKYHLQQNNGVAKRMIYTLGFVAMFILLMAVINFINISVGSSVSRLREIGVRKVMGGLRRQLVMQFMVESLVLVTFAMLFALAIYQLASPLFSQFLGTTLPAVGSFPPVFALVMLLLTLLTGLLAGLYPALVLSAQPSVDSLKGKLKTVKEKIAFRHSLIALQFTTALIVFAGSVVIGKQISYFFNKSLGYDKEHVITAAVPRDWTPEGVRRMETIRNEFATLPEVAAASFSFEIPDGASGSNFNVFKAAEDSSRGVATTSIAADEKYAATYKIPLATGHFFHAAGGGYDSLKLVINEALARALGWKDAQQAIGQQVRIQGDTRTFTVQGITKDFHFGSMHKSIQPIVFMHVRNYLAHRYLSFRVKPGNTAATLQSLQKKWSQLFPDAPFDYKFMDDTLASLYKSELQMKKAAQTATILALIIVLLGVSGVVSLSIAKRTKEVGIRKVLGASVPNIIWLFLKEFSVIVLAAICIALPVAYVLLSNWLSGYAYRISMGITPFVIVSICMVALVSLLIVVQTSAKAIANPVKSLRTE